MTAALDYAAFDRWRADPIAFIEQVLCDPETGKPFALLPAERNSSGTRLRVATMVGSFTPSKSIHARKRAARPRSRPSTA